VVVRAICGCGRTGERDKSVTPTRCVPRRSGDSEPPGALQPTRCRHRTSPCASARRHPDAGQSTPPAGCSVRVWWSRALGRTPAAVTFGVKTFGVVLECHSWSLHSRIRCRGLPIAGSGSRGTISASRLGANRPQRRAVHRPVLPLLVLPAGPRLLWCPPPRQWERRGSGTSGSRRWVMRAPWNTARTRARHRTFDPAGRTERQRPGRVTLTLPEPSPQHRPGCHQPEAITPRRSWLSASGHEARCGQGTRSV
jgi:hypothetical protein